jgi:hypothetical protein
MMQKMLLGSFAGIWAFCRKFGRFLGTRGFLLAFFSILPARRWEISRHNWALMGKIRAS